MLGSIDWKDALRNAAGMSVETDEDETVTYINEKYSFINDDYIVELKERYTKREAFRRQYEKDEEINDMCALLDGSKQLPFGN